MFSVLATEPKVRRFKSSRGYWLIRRSAPSFGGEVKPSAPCRKILRNVNITLNTNQGTSEAKCIISVAISSWFATRWLLVIFPETLVEESVFPCRYHSTMSFHAHISPGEWTIGPLVATVQRRVFTPPTWSSSLWSKMRCCTLMLIVLGVDTIVLHKESKSQTVV
jgi:hypothetical protein